MYPWYVSYQVISELLQKKMGENPLYPTIF
jgi:hypothetical protein